MSVLDTGWSREGLQELKQQLEIHIEICCAAAEGTCSKLERLGEVQYLLGEAS